MFGKSDRKKCPLLNKPCIGSECMWATRLQGNDPQTGNPIDEESCAVTWLPMLLTQSIQASHQVGAAVESARNQAVKGNEESVALTKDLVDLVRAGQSPAGYSLDCSSVQPRFSQSKSNQCNPFISKNPHE